MRSKLRALVLALCSSVLAAGAAYALDASGPHAAVLPAGAFLSTNVDTLWGAKFYRYPSSTEAVELRAPVSLPSGAAVYQFGIYAYDASATGDITAELWSIPADPTQDPELIKSISTTGSSGYQYVEAVPGSINYLVNNDLLTGGSNVYMVVHLPANAQAEAAFKGVDFRYNLTVWETQQLSPTFNDVPKSSPYYFYIEALVRGEITAGCGDFNYCPDAPVTRAQMAVFLAKALGLYYP